MGNISYAGYDFHDRSFLQNFRPRIQSFVVKAGEKELRIQRRPSTIWRQDFLEAMQTDPWASLDAAHGLLLTSNMILKFEAEAIPALINRPYEAVDFQLRDIEWLNTGPDNGMLKHGLRHGYNYKMKEIALQHDPKSLDVIAICYGGL